MKTETLKKAAAALAHALKTYKTLRAEHAARRVAPAVVEWAAGMVRALRARLIAARLAYAGTLARRAMLAAAQATPAATMWAMLAALPAHLASRVLCDLSAPVCAI